MRNKALVLVLFVATLILSFPGVASAAAFSVVHSFSGPDGETPAAPLVQGADGFTYGVAAHGGDFTVLPPDGGGTVFRLNAGRRRSVRLDPGSRGLLLRHRDLWRPGRHHAARAGGRDDLPDGRSRHGYRPARLPGSERGLSPGADRAGHGRCPLRGRARRSRVGVRLPVRPDHRRLPAPPRLRLQRRQVPDRTALPGDRPVVLRDDERGRTVELGRCL